MSTIEEAITAIRKEQPRRVVSSACTYAIPATAAEATPPLVEAIPEVQS